MPADGQGVGEDTYRRRGESEQECVCERERKRERARERKTARQEVGRLKRADRAGREADELG